MTLALCVLGSGSGGNSTLLSFSVNGTARFALIDCGLSVRETRRRLAPLGITLEDIDDILITHFDTDHFQPSWCMAATKHGIRLRVHARQQRRAIAAGVSGVIMERFDDGFSLNEVTDVHAVHFAHDELGTVGFVIEHRGTRLGFATDLGRVPEHLFEKFVDLHAVALESNYDPQMQLGSQRPWFLKKRIMGGRGHLSNQQSLDAVLRIEKRSALSHVVMLHLSRQCNDPRLIKRLYSERAPHLFDRLTVTNQFEPTQMLDVVAGPAPAVKVAHMPREGEQLAIF